MPIIKSAIKKMRQDRARTKINRAKKDALKKVLKEALTKKSAANLNSAFSALDKAAKTGLIPKGRVNRQKSRLAKKVAIASTSKTASKPARKKTVKKAKR